MRLSLPLRRVLLLLVLFLITGGILLANQWQLADANAYFGYKSIVIDAAYMLMWAFGVVLAALAMPLRVTRPSDFFRFFHLLLVVLPYLVLAGVRGEVDWSVFMPTMLVLIVPLVVVRLVSLSVPPIRPLGLMSPRTLLTTTLAFCAVAAVVAVLWAPPSAGFELSYDRRIEGRDVFRAGSPLAYMLVAAANGFAPFLAFLAGAGERHRLQILAVALACELALYYSIGLKAPLLLALLAFVAGVALRKQRADWIPRVALLGLCAALAVFVVEYLLADYSYVNDYLIRRLLTVPAFAISAYGEFMFANAAWGWSPLSGVDIDVPISFHIGEVVLGFPGLNANTNTFVNTLAAGGLPSYAGTIALVAAVFAALDGVYRVTRNHALLYLGLLFSLLLTEQAATTVLMSSGFAALIAMVVMTRLPRGSASPSHSARLPPTKPLPDLNWPHRR